MKAIDQRKRSRASTCAKKAAAGRLNTGSSAFIPKTKKEKDTLLQKRIEMVVQMAALNVEISKGENTKDVIKGHRGYTSMHAVKIG